jgi:hypothetical protein
MDFDFCFSVSGFRQRDRMSFRYRIRNRVQPSVDAITSFFFVTDVAEQ